jgi:adenylate cyclase
MAIDFESEGLLEGLEGHARAARRELLEQLAQDGVPLEELRVAAADGRLPLLPVERVLTGGGPRYDRDEIAERSGLALDALERYWRAIGFATPAPEERIFTESDVEAAKRIKTLLDAGLDEDDILDVARVVRRAMTGVAAATGTVFARAFLEPGDDERSLAERYAEASKQLTPLLGPMLEHALGVQQRALIRQAAVDASALDTGRVLGTMEVTVCFADLVGFTKLGERMDAAQVAAVAGRLEKMADDVAGSEVRLVKTIGDAVMLESRDTDALLDAALSLVRAADEEGEGFPQLRAGAARGEALPRAGDWFGRPVNLASRITAVAHPGSLLVDEAVKEAAKREYRWSYARARRLKGVDGEVRLWRVRPPEPEARPE